MGNVNSVSTGLMGVLGGGAILVAALCLGGTYYIENEIGKAVLLGAFVISLLNSIIIFGLIRGDGSVKSEPTEEK